MSDLEGNINEHPINVAAKAHLERFNVSANPKKAHVFELMFLLIATNGLDYQYDDDHIIKHYIDKYLWKTDNAPVNFLLKEVEPEYIDEYVEQIVQNINEIKDELVLRDYLIDVLLVPAIQDEVDWPIFKKRLL
ncbi:hypothetical protein [Rhodohalobacter sulfatireducens]|uniref:Uncharacterized protein n=1 Tax=Rhodohalobacter sulfatireducens TaxID=2911366 RepID=A0ABS9KA90_9BACT|nr:hypothetical protein [Rhodohalobacter sulfatireducens]MCG2587769.1 hypothetical protein [Rhodohalobacter sulfatireducens]